MARCSGLTGLRKLWRIPFNTILMLVICDFWARNSIRASPLAAADLSLGLSLSSDMMVDGQQTNKPMDELMVQILNDKYEHDFALSIALLNQFTTTLEDFIRSKHLESLVENKDENVVSSWATNNGVSNQPITRELDLVVATFWSQFKPTLESVIVERPMESMIWPVDLDFRCTKRRAELGKLMALGAQSSLYSIFMDTFLSELYQHCLIRKLAKLKINGVEPSPLLKQFVAIYLNLPVRDSDTAETKQLLSERAKMFNPANAFATIGPLTQAASLVVDTRTFLSSAPDAAQAAKMAQEFIYDCQSYLNRLALVWGDFDDFINAISTSTTNLDDLNQRVKFAAPRLAYGAICGQLLPR